jgi:predicted transposase YdaD
MKTDSFFCNFFQNLPKLFFRLIDRPETNVDNYTMRSLEFKDTGTRLDGVFEPHAGTPGPVFIWEAQFYKDNNFYALMASRKARYWLNFDRKREVICVAIYPSRKFEAEEDEPMRDLVKGGLVRIFLDELPEAGPDEIELAILQMIVIDEKRILPKARELTQKAKDDKLPPDVQASLLQFLSSAIVIRLPKISIKELEMTFTKEDFKKSLAVREMMEEARNEALVDARKERDALLKENNIAFAKRLLLRGDSVASVVEVTGLPLIEVKKLVNVQ